MERTVETVLRCEGCGTTGPHLISYSAGAISAVRCLTCGREIDPASPRRAGRGWVRRLSRRFVSKPGRVLGEVREHPIRFALSVPRRLLSKPVRLAAELAGRRADAPARPPLPHRSGRETPPD